MKKIWNGDEALSELKKLAVTLGHTPTQIECRLPGFPSRKVFISRFGSFKKACLRAGLTPNENFKFVYSKESLIEHIKAASEKLGRSPRLKDLKVDSKTFIYHFGSFRKAVTSSGFDPYRRYWTKDKMRSMVREFVKDNKRNPITTDFQHGSKNGLPAESSLKSVYGTAEKAVEDFAAHGCLRNKPVKNPERRFVMTAGVLNLYRDKEPYVQSGVSTFGAIEYDADSDEMRCHECGQWYGLLHAHIKNAHGMKAREYKLKHGLRISTALVSEGTRIKLIKNALIPGAEGVARLLKARPAQHIISEAVSRGVRSQRHERRNSMNNCAPQLLKRIKALADQVGHTPSVSELEEARIGRSSIIFHFGSLSAAMKLCSLKPRKQFQTKYTRREIIGMVKNFAEVHKRSPTSSDIERGFFPCYAAIRTHFKSLSHLRRAAGTPPVYIGRKKHNQPKVK